MGILLKKWLLSPERAPLLRWSAGFFTYGTLLCLAVGLRYFSAYQLPREPLAIAYTIAAFTGHIASCMLAVWIALMLPLVAVAPFRKAVIPAGVLAVSLIISLVLLDSQIYAAHRFHFTLLTIRILGWKTWGFGIFYVAMLIVFNSFLARIAWNRHVVMKKKLHIALTLPVMVILLLFTHGTHIWADATGYVPVTRFTMTLPLFYPSTAKKQMVKFGFADISNRRGMPAQSYDRSEFKYPSEPLAFNPPSSPLNILLIAVDDMRGDLLTDEYAPRCMKFARDSGNIFTNHWSGGNSTKMGLFSLFYGIPPTYQQYVESNKHSPVLIDRLLEMRYAAGIFTSYNLYRPAGLDITAFVKIANLRMETIIPGPKKTYRNDSAITDEWKRWLDGKDTAQPFFGFLFYDALCNRAFPPSYEKRLAGLDGELEERKEFIRYVMSMSHIDSLAGAVLDDLAARGILERTIVIITSDHGEEFDDNKLGINGHGSAFSDWQLRVPLIVYWPGKSSAVTDKRTSHNDIVATLMGEALGCANPSEVYSSGNNLFSEKQWEWLIAGSYYNFAIIEPQQVTIQFPGGYYEIRDHAYRHVKKASPSANIVTAFNEMGKFYKQ